MKYKLFVSANQKELRNENKTMEIISYCEQFKVNEKTARRDLRKLINVGFVKKIGSTKGAVFKAK